MRAQVGDWVVRKGEVYPATPWLVTAWPDTGGYLICERRWPDGRHEQTAFFSFDVETIKGAKTK